MRATPAFDHAAPTSFHRAARVTLDLIGVTPSLRESVTRRVEQTLGIAPAAVLMNASHTHCGPACDAS